MPPGMAQGIFRKLFASQQIPHLLDFLFKFSLQVCFPILFLQPGFTKGNLFVPIVRTLVKSILRFHFHSLIQQLTNSFHLFSGQIIGEPFSTFSASCNKSVAFSERRERCRRLRISGGGCTTRHGCVNSAKISRNTCISAFFESLLRPIQPMRQFRFLIVCKLAFQLLLSGSAARILRKTSMA